MQVPTKGIASNVMMRTDNVKNLTEGDSKKIAMHDWNIICTAKIKL